jgi:hypothetical protein
MQRFEIFVFSSYLEVWGQPYWTLWRYGQTRCGHGPVVFRGSAGRHHWTPGTTSRSPGVGRRRCAISSVTLNTLKPLGWLGANGSSADFTVEQMVCRTLEVYERVLADAPV